MTLNMLIGILEQGLIYGIMAMGLLITYRILDFPDLTVDSSFPLGAAVSATLTLQGVAPWLTLLIGCAAGGIAGLITGLIHVKCRVRDLLSGIITMTGLYSINLHIAQNKADLPLFGGDTLFRNAFTKSLPKAISPYTTLIIIFLIALIAKSSSTSSCGRSAVTSCARRATTRPSSQRSAATRARSKSLV